MKQSSEKVDNGERAAELLRKLIIVQLGLAGVGQANIRKVVGGGMGEINGIVKLIRSGQAKREAQ